MLLLWTFQLKGEEEVCEEIEVLVCPVGCMFDSKSHTVLTKRFETLLRILSIFRP